MSQAEENQERMAVHFVDREGVETAARFEEWGGYPYAWLVVEDPESYRNIVAPYSPTREVGTWHYAE